MTTGTTTVVDSKIPDVNQVDINLKSAAHDIALRLEAADERREMRENRRAIVMGLAALAFGTMQAVALAWINSTYHLTNSMKDELVAVTAKNSRAEGVIEGRAEQKQKQK